MRHRFWQISGKKEQPPHAWLSLPVRLLGHRRPVCQPLLFQGIDFASTWLALLILLGLLIVRRPDHELHVILTDPGVQDLAVEGRGHGG